MQKSPTEDQLPATSYVVLGLVSFQEASGYDLKRFADASIRHFYWSPSKSQIYAELRRLTSLGYATERHVQQERRPNKRLYRVTPSGEEALREWLGQPQTEPDVIKRPLLVKLFLGSMMSQDILVGQIEEGRRQSEVLLAQFKSQEKEISDRGELFFPYLTLKSGILHMRANLQWADEVLQRIKTRSS